MGLEKQTMNKMKTLTETEMQYLTAGDGPIDSTPLPPIQSSGMIQLQWQMFLDNLGQQQRAVYYRWLHMQAS
jgi:hypothetical protein